MIDVGLIGCGKRALWYGAIFADIDPNVYAALDPAAYHHMTYYQHVELQVARPTGFRLVKIHDSDQQAAKVLASAFRTKPEMCATLDEVSKGTDLVFVTEDGGDGARHLELASPGLSRGVPTFVDRPFAGTVKDAKAMVALAKRSGAPLLSCSHLRMLPAAARFKARFPEIGAVEMGIVLGHGPNPAQVADGIDLALFLFGDEFGGQAASVQSMGGSPLEVALITFSSGERGPRKRQRRRTAPVPSERVLQVLVNNLHADLPRSSFWAKAVSHGNALDSPDFGAFAQTEGGVAVMNALKDMVLTGGPPLSYEHLLEPVAIVEAGRKAHKRPRPVSLAALR